MFTPYWRTCLASLSPDDPLPAPKTVPSLAKWPKSVKLEALGLEPKINWAEGFAHAWQPGEAGAQSQLKQFTRGTLFDYSTGRNRPDHSGTSRLSPHLHFGELSPRQIWTAVQKAAERRHVPASQWKHWQFLAELGWRDFSHHLLFHFPHTARQPLREEFRRFPWHTDNRALRAWQQGQTGYPIVDAGMRELWTTGWMHNRVRMIVASFLVKDLMLPWPEGARWFWDTLVDADLANNTQGWQWTAGCGADAAPYFRVFNPVSQGQKFDPEGDYVRRWIPELAKLPTKWIHHPWEAPAEALVAAGVQFDKTYPAPIVSHAIAREVALEAYRKMKGASNQG